MKRVFLSLLLLLAGFCCLAQSQQQIITAYQSLKNNQYGEAWRLSRQLLVDGNLSPDDSALVAYILLHASLDYAGSLPEDDIQPCQEAIEVCRFTASFLSKDNKWYPLLKKKEATSWLGLALCWYPLSYDTAYHCYSEALALFHELNRTRDEAVCLHSMAELKGRTYEFDSAQYLYALSEHLASESNDTLVWISVLSDWQSFLYDMGRLNERNEVMLKLQRLGGGSYDAQKVVDDAFLQARMAEKKHDFQLAEYYYLLALHDAEHLPDFSKNSKVSMAFNELAYLKYHQDLYDAAIHYANKYLDFNRKCGYEGGFAFMYILVAESYSQLQDKENALRYIDSANVSVGNRFEYLLRVYHGQTACFLNLQMYDKALEVAERADSLVVAQYGLNDGRRYLTLSYKGKSLYKLQRYKEYVLAYAECEQLSNRVFGPSSSNHVDALDALVNAMALAGDIEGGADKYVDLVNIVRRKVVDEMSALSLSEREPYWNEFSDCLRWMTSFGLKGQVSSPRFINTACEALLFSQSMLLESEVTLQQLVDQSGSLDDKQRLQIIKNNFSKIKELSNDYEKNGSLIAQLKNEVDANERSLAANFKQYADYVNSLNVSLDEVIDALPDNAILINFNDIRSGSKYFHAAFVTNKNDRKTDMLLVFEWSQVEKLLDGAPIDVLYKEYMNDSAMSMIWGPLSRYATEGCSIYYVPSGMMHQISLESFTAPDGKLLGDHYHFVRLSSARELLKSDDVPKAPARSVLYGGLQYEVSPDSMYAESSKYQLSHLLADSRGSNRGDGLFDPLPNTLLEVDSIAALLRLSGVDVASFHGMAGNEESFLSMSGNSPDLLHVATHGFYYSPGEADNVSYLKGYNDAMMLSGLVMAGANAAKRGLPLPEGVFDGILSAADIAKMDMSGTDLVVLSACQTGLGKVTAEGVYGLQRAFKRAGVRTIVMTLWDVNDRVTCLFMTKFYRCLVTNGWDKRRAFDEARNAIRSLYPDAPYYWAAFVMVD